MNHSSTYDMAWWGELRLGRGDAAWHDLRRGRRWALHRGTATSRSSGWAPTHASRPGRRELVRSFKLRNRPSRDPEVAQGFRAPRQPHGHSRGATRTRARSSSSQGHRRAAAGSRHDRARRRAPHAGPSSRWRQTELDCGRPAGKTREMQLQQREWPVHLASLGPVLRHAAGGLRASLAWQRTAAGQRQGVRALYALGRDAVARRRHGARCGLEGALRDCSRRYSHGTAARRPAARRPPRGTWRHRREPCAQARSSTSGIRRWCGSARSRAPRPTSIAGRGN